jgi:uncharacterized protein (DUF1697 family)
MIHVALIRGINVGGHKQVAMADLLTLMAKLGLSNPRSLLQSGNLVFENAGRTAEQLERLLEAEIERRMAMKLDVFVRTAEEWTTIVRRNPFTAEAERDPARLIVMFLKDAPEAKDVKAVRAAISGPETIQVVGRHGYVVYPAGMGNSRLTHAVLERKLARRGTARNWNTVLKLAALTSRGG